MRLEIHISGVFHVIALLHLSRPAIKVLQQKEPENWRSHLGLMTVGPNRKQLLSDFLTLGRYVPKVNIFRRGMYLQAKHFGLEALVDGCDQVPEEIDSKQTELQLLPLLRDFGPEDLLGVFQLQADATMIFSWEVSSPFDEHLIQLHLENFGQLLNTKERFDLIRAVTYNTTLPDNKKLESLSRSKMLKHIFHVPSIS